MAKLVSFGDDFITELSRLEDETAALYKQALAGDVTAANAVMDRIERTKELLASLGDDGRPRK